MNPTILLILGILWAASVGGSFFYGQAVGVDSEVAKQATAAEHVQAMRDAAQQGAAAEIAKLKPRNVTIRQEVEREIRTNTVYADCKLPAAGLRLVNEALTGERKPQPPGGGKLPPADAAAAPGR
jgi:hypothetical protein